MSNPNSAAQSAFTHEPYDSLPVLLASKRITDKLVGKRLYTKDGHCFDVVASAGEQTTAGGAELVPVPGNPWAATGTLTVPALEALLLPIL